MKAVLFDWDGVLIDSTVMYFDIYRQLTEHYRKYLPVRSVEEFRSWYDPAWENNYFEMGFTRGELPMVAEFIHARLDYSALSLFPGAADALRSLHRDYRTAIVSTTPRGVILQRLRAEGLDQYTDYITGDDGISSKTAKIADTLKILDCSEAVMVGDTPLDITSGQANSLATVGVTYGWVTAERVNAAHPTLSVAAPQELEQAVRSLLSQLSTDSSL